MKILFKVALFILALMSMAAGIAKVLQMPQEVGLFAQAGLGIISMLSLGTIQVVGGVATLIPKLRHFGLIAVIIGFSASVLVIAITGDLAFAAISVLPVVLSIGVLLRERRRIG